MIAIAQFLAGTTLASWMTLAIDSYDDHTGTRLGASYDGYGANVSYTWRNVLATLGFLMAATAPITVALCP